MKVKVVGLKSVNFKDDNTGREISGTSMYVTYEDPNVIGVRTDKFFIRPSMNFELNLIKPGSTVVDIYFDRYGKVDGFDIIEE